MSDANRDKHRKHEFEQFRTPIVLAVTVIGVWGLSWALLTTFIDNPESRGLFGDMFGATNALFSGLALGGVVYAIFLQRQELQLQREELELTRAELRRSAEAQEKSERALVKQAKALANTARANTMNLMPTILCKFGATLARGGWSSVTAEVSNVGNVLAFDVDVWLICMSPGSDSDLQDIIHTHVCPQFRSELSKIHCTEDTFYGIRTQLRLPAVTPRRRRSVDLRTPTIPKQIHALVQFRDVQGRNYAQIYHTEHIGENSLWFRLSNLTPTTPLAHPRTQL